MSTALSSLLDVHISLSIAVDCKDLYRSLSTQRNSVNKSIHGDVSLIRHDFECSSIEWMIWIPVRENFVDPGTNHDSPLEPNLQLVLDCGRRPIDFSKQKYHGRTCRLDE